MMTSGGGDEKKLKGVRRRKWGKWVSEIRVPGTQERLWLGTYSTPQAAAVAHDAASYCLRGLSSVDRLNFPLMLPAARVRESMSLESIQKAASDAGMAVDAQLIRRSSSSPENDVLASDQAAGGAALSSGRTGLETIELWDELDCGDDRGKWVENAARPEGEGCLSISVEDYI